MREAEGEKLKADVLYRADEILKKVEVIEERSPETVKEYNDKLLARIKEFLSDVQVDEQRILTECAIFADKVAVAEETVRLRSHIDQLRLFMDSNEAIGRKIDFLVQEMNREANTIGSKAQDVTIARNVIDIKAEIEKMLGNLKEAGVDGEGYVNYMLKNSIDRYAYCFGMHGLTSKLLKICGK